MRYIYILVSLAVFVSCKNEDNTTPEFPKELYLTQLKKKNGIRLYSNMKEIQDQQAANNFVRDLTYFHVKDSLIIDGNRKLTFDYSDTASISQLWKKLIIKMNGNMFLFKSSIQIPVPESWGKNVLPMSKYRSELGLQWYDGDYRIPIMITGYGDYDKIEIPVFNYKVVKRDKYIDQEGYYRAMSSGNTYNEFDDSYIKTVRPTDTLAIEEYLLVFTRKN